MKRKVQFDKRLFAKEPRYKLPSPEENAFDQLRTLSQWLLVVPFIMVVLFAAGQLAIFGDTAIAFADASSNLSAEYSPWSFIQVHPVLASIVEEIRRDFEKITDPRQTFSDPIEEQGFAFIERDGSVLVAALPAPVEQSSTNSSSANTFGAGEPSPEGTISRGIPSPTPTQLLTSSETLLPSSSTVPVSTQEPTNDPTSVISTQDPTNSPTSAILTATTNPASTPVPTVLPTATTAAASPIGWWNGCFPYRQQITVNTSSASVANGYTVSYTFNHQSLVSAGRSRSDGRDLRVARVSGSNWTQLDRVIDDDSAWDRTNSRVLFKLQSGITAQSSDNSYYMYYGCSSDGNVREDPKNVYWYFTDFDNAGDINDWAQYEIIDDEGWRIEDKMLELQSGRQGVEIPYLNDKIVLTARPAIHHLQVEFEFLAEDDDLLAAGLCSNDSNMAGFYIGISQDWWFDDSSGPQRIGYWNSVADNAYSGTSYNEYQWYEVTHAWTSSSIKSTFAGGNFQWNSGPSSANYFCFAGNGMDEVVFENLMLRLYVSPEPVLALGPTENSP